MPHLRKLRYRRPLRERLKSAIRYLVTGTTLLTIYLKFDLNAYPIIFVLKEKVYSFQFC